MGSSAAVAKKGFWQFWTCPKCNTRQSTYRMSASEGKEVGTYCSLHGGSVKIKVERPRQIGERRKDAPAQADAQPDFKVPSLGVLCALASIAVHVQEAISPNGHPLDVVAAKSALEAGGVQNWLDWMAKAGYAPVKR